jgi:hypothetical protein
MEKNPVKLLERLKEIVNAEISNVSIHDEAAAAIDQLLSLATQPELPKAPAQ